jgi:hypothetical protein
MDTETTPSAPAPPATGDRLGAEVRESALLLLFSLAVTVGLASGVQAVLAVVG